MTAVPLHAGGSASFPIVACPHSNYTLRRHAWRGLGILALSFIRPLRSPHCALKIPGASVKPHQFLMLVHFVLFHGSTLSTASTASAFRLSVRVPNGTAMTGICLGISVCGKSMCAPAVAAHGEARRKSRVQLLHRIVVYSTEQRSSEGEA